MKKGEAELKLELALDGIHAALKVMSTDNDMRFDGRTKAEQMADLLEVTLRAVRTASRD